MSALYFPAFEGARLEAGLTDPFVGYSSRCANFEGGLRAINIAKPHRQFIDRCNAVELLKRVLRTIVEFFHRRANVCLPCFRRTDSMIHNAAGYRRCLIGNDSNPVELDRGALPLS